MTTANTYDVGETVRMRAVFTDTGGDTTDPSNFKLFLEAPGSTTAGSTWTYGTSTALKKESSGTFYLDYTTTGSGAYEYRFTSTGAAAVSQENFFYVRAQRVTT